MKCFGPRSLFFRTFVRVMAKPDFSFCHRHSPSFGKYNNDKLELPQMTKFSYNLDAWQRVMCRNRALEIWWCSKQAVACISAPFDRFSRAELLFLQLHPTIFEELLTINRLSACLYAREISHHMYHRIFIHAIFRGFLSILLSLLSLQSVEIIRRSIATSRAEDPSADSIMSRVLTFWHQ